MKVSSIVVSICLGLSAPAFAQSAAKGKTTSSARASKAQVEEIRSIVHELERLSSKLDVLLKDAHSISAQRPPKSQKKQLARWDSAFNRVLRSMQKTHTALIEATKRLDQATGVKMPTSLDKEVANARLGADPLLVAGKQVLTKNRARLEKKARSAKKKPAAAETDELRLDDPLL